MLISFKVFPVGVRWWRLSGWQTLKLHPHFYKLVHNTNSTAFTFVIFSLIRPMHSIIIIINNTENKSQHFNAMLFSIIIQIHFCFQCISLPSIFTFMLAFKGIYSTISTEYDCLLHYKNGHKLWCKYLIHEVDKSHGNSWTKSTFFSLNQLFEVSLYKNIKN